MGKKIKIGLGLLIIRDNKVLLGKRKKVSHQSQVYAAPGGCLEYGETLEEGIKREVFEETGLKIGKIHLILMKPYVFEENMVHYLNFGFWTKDFSGKAKLKEPDKCYFWQWYDFNYLPVPLYIATKDLIESYKAKKQRFCFEEIVWISK